MINASGYSLLVSFFRANSFLGIFERVLNEPKKYEATGIFQES